MTAQGTLVAIDGKAALRFERRYQHPPERVWRAVTDPDELAQWFPSQVLGERRVGAELVFDDDDQRAAAQDAGEPARAEGPMFRGKVVTYDPPQVFSFTWGGELLRFELLPDGDDTILIFTQVLTHRSVAARNGAGWHECLRGLDGLLARDQAPGTAQGEDQDGWMDVYITYLMRMGPELGKPEVGGAMTWERATHVEPERVREATTDPAELDNWKGSEHAAEPVSWDIEPTEHGTLYRLTHRAIGDDAELAATWHARLTQLDMYLAAGQLVPVEPKLWLADYEDLL